MLTINQLMKYLRSKHNIAVKSNQAQDLRNMGYYHGFKGYRFIRVPSQRISFTSLDEIIALNKFDMKLKALFYPKVMFIENALKIYVIESTLKMLNRRIWYFFSCANSDVKLYTSATLHLPSNLDADGKITEYIIYELKDLRNAVAHNNIILIQDL